MTPSDPKAPRAPRHPLADPPALSREDAVARIAAIIRRERAERAAKQAADEATPSATTADGSEPALDLADESAAGTPAPPPSWSRDDLVVFFSLPPEAQAIIARRERERDSGIRRRLDTIAKDLKAMEDERAKAAQLLAELEQRLAALPPMDEAGLPSPSEALTEAPSDPLQLQPEDTWRAKAREALARQAETLALLKRRREMTALLTAIPEWSESHARETEALALNRFLAAMGFGQDELGELTDHRLIVLARKAMLYDQLMRSKPLAEKKLATASPMLSPGAAPSRKSEHERRRSSLIQRYRDTGRHEDAVAVIADYIRN
jgi:hypothetical protein